jgi:hypothetical protein
MLPTASSSLLRTGDALPCEMIKPNPINSHDWHVQPYCQRSLRVIPLRETLWIEAQTMRFECPRTCCAAAFSALYSALRRFCANFLRVSNFRPLVNRYLSLLFSPSGPPRHNAGGSFPDLKRNASKLTIERLTCLSKTRFAHKSFKERPALLTPLEARQNFSKRRTLGSCIGFVLCGIPYRGLGTFLLIHPTLRTGFPSSQAGRPNGHRKATLQSTTFRD